ncbi:hypothetical protein Q4I28_000396, partial [Leishmania naiffi]
SGPHAAEGPTCPSSPDGLTLEKRLCIWAFPGWPSLALARPNRDRPGHGSCPVGLQEWGKDGRPTRVEILTADDAALALARTRVPDEHIQRREDTAANARLEAAPSRFMAAARACCQEARRVLPWDGLWHDWERVRYGAFEGPPGGLPHAEEDRRVRSRAAPSAL